MITQERGFWTRTIRFLGGILRLLLLEIAITSYTSGQDNSESDVDSREVVAMIRRGEVNHPELNLSRTPLEFDIPDQGLRQILVNVTLDGTVVMSQDHKSPRLSGNVTSWANQDIWLGEMDAPNLRGEQDTTSTLKKERIRRMVAEEFKQHRRSTILTSVIVGIPTGFVLGVKFAHVSIGDPVGPWSAVLAAFVALPAGVTGATVTPALLFLSIKAATKHAIKKRLLEEMKEDSENHPLREKTNRDHTTS